MAELYKSVSPYYTTIKKNNVVSYLDIMNFRSIPEDDSDIALSIHSKYNTRPDLLSNNLYGTPDLWWVFIVRNPDQMIDPIYGLITGLEIYVPTKDRIFGILGL